MTCKLCDRAWDRFWAYSDDWERSVSNRDQLLSEESEQSWDLIQRAAQLDDSSPAAAFQLSLEAVEAGSVWAMEKVAWHYWTGTGVAADPYAALEYYYRAICGGSWMATLHYARLLEELGHHDHWQETLETGVACDFVPAYFWLGWFRYQHSTTTTAREDVRPLLEYAAANGHPGAKVVLARWMMRGKFGLSEIPRGFRLAFQGIVDFVRRNGQVDAS